jgi:hypothetical protein
MFLRKYKEKQIVCLDKVLTEGAFVAQLSRKAGFSVWRILLGMTNCLTLNVVLCLLQQVSAFVRHHLGVYTSIFET